MGAINQALASDKILRVNDFELLGMVQNFDWTPELGAQDIYELGSQKKVDTAYDLRVSGSFEQAAIGNTAGVLARMIVTRDSTDLFTGFLYNSGGASGKNGYTLTEAELVETRFDLIQHERPDGKDFTRSLWFPRCHLASISGSCRADGFASESFSWRAPEVQGFNTPYHDIRAIPATRTSTTQATMADTVMTSYTLAYVYVNDRRFRNNTTSDSIKFTMSAGGILTLSAGATGYTIPADADIMAVVYKTTGSSTFPSITSNMRGTTATYVRGQQVNIYIAPVTVGTPLDSEKFLRVQSLDWSIDMGLQELMELQQNDKGSATYTEVPTLPFNISCNATVYETDWRDWKALLSKGFVTDVYDSTYELAPSVIKTQFAIVVEYYTKANPAAKLQVWQFKDMAPSGRGTRVGVRGRGEVSWSFSGTSFQLQGFNV